MPVAGVSGKMGHGHGRWSIRRNVRLARAMNINRIVLLSFIQWRPLHQTLLVNEKWPMAPSLFGTAAGWNVLSAKKLKIAPRRTEGRLVLHVVPCWALPSVVVVGRQNMMDTSRSLPEGLGRCRPASLPTVHSIPRKRSCCGRTTIATSTTTTTTTSTPRMRDAGSPAFRNKATQQPRAG